jgi:hypothetical protein
LKGIYDDLAPLSEWAHRPDADPIPTSRTTTAWSNLFEHLPSKESEIPATYTLIPTTSKVTISKVKYVLESSDEDEQLAAIMFMKDMNEARAIVATEWALFKDGQSAYTTAAEIDNAATSIYFRLHPDFTKTNPTL